MYIIKMFCSHQSTKCGKNVTIIYVNHIKSKSAVQGNMKLQTEITLKIFS